MLKIITTLTLILFGLLAKAQSTESRPVSEFCKVDVKNGIQLIYTESALPLLQLEAKNQAVLNDIVTEVQGNTLKIYSEKGQTQEVKVYISASNLKAMSASSKASINIINEMTAANIKITLHSGASFTGNLNATGKTKIVADSGTLFTGRVDGKSIMGNLKKNARVNLTGKVQFAAFSTTDSALLNAKNFIANAIHLNAAGKSTAIIHAETDVVLNVTDLAQVTYSGLPNKIEWNEEAVAVQKQNGQSLSFN